jgi:hypothetical protein
MYKPFVHLRKGVGTVLNDEDVDDEDPKTKEKSKKDAVVDEVEDEDDAKVPANS